MSDALQGRKLRIAFITIATFLIFYTEALGFEIMAEQFLGPKPGISLIFKGPDHVSLEVRTKKSSKMNELHILERLHFTERTGQDKALKNNHTVQLENHYTLKAIGSKLVMEKPDGEITLADFAAKTWMISLKTYGSMYAADSIGICRIISTKELMFWGEKRLMIKVECVPRACALKNHPLTWELMSGLGLVSRGGLTLVSTERNSVHHLRSPSQKSDANDQ